MYTGQATTIIRNSYSLYRLAHTYSIVLQSDVRLCSLTDVRTSLPDSPRHTSHRLSLFTYSQVDGVVEVQRGRSISIL